MGARAPATGAELHPKRHRPSKANESRAECLPDQYRGGLAGDYSHSNYVRGIAQERAQQVLVDGRHGAEAARMRPHIEPVPETAESAALNEAGREAGRVAGPAPQVARPVHPAEVEGEQRERAGHGGQPERSVCIFLEINIHYRHALARGPAAAGRIYPASSGPPVGRKTLWRNEVLRTWARRTRGPPRARGVRSARGRSDESLPRCGPACGLTRGVSPLFGAG